MHKHLAQRDELRCHSERIPPSGHVRADVVLLRGCGEGSEEGSISSRKGCWWHGQGGKQRGVLEVCGVHFVEGFVVGLCPGLDAGEGLEFGEDGVSAWWGGAQAGGGFALELGCGADAV